MTGGAIGAHGSGAPWVQAKIRATGNRQSASAGSASAISPEVNVAGWSGGAGPILPDEVGNGVHIPDDEGAGLEVVGPLGGLRGFGGLAVVVFAADLDGELRGAREKPHGVGRERPRRSRRHPG